MPARLVGPRCLAQRSIGTTELGNIETFSNGMPNAKARLYLETCAVASLRLFPRVF